MRFEPVALTAFASLVVAIPTYRLGLPVSRHGFKNLNAPVDIVSHSVQQESAGTRVKHGPSQLLKSRQKYSMPISEDLAAAAQQSGSVQANGKGHDHEEMWIIPLQVGTPAQTLRVELDTGSSDLWVFSTEQPSSQQSGHKVYNIDDSSSAVLDAGETWSVSYADGSGAEGVVYTDTVSLGGVSSSSQAVQVATDVSLDFSQGTKYRDGIVGMGFDNINTVTPNQVSTWFTNVEGSLPSSVFTAQLKHNAPGYYTFGYIDSSMYSGELTYTSVNSASGYWEIQVDGFGVGGLQSYDTFNAIVDTGTSLLLLPDEVVGAYYSQVEGAVYDGDAGGFIFPESSLASLPSLSLQIGGASQTVPGSLLSYGYILTHDGTRYYFGGIQSSDGTGITLLGDVFLRAVYAVFDVGNSRVGFAAQA